MFSSLKLSGTSKSIILLSTNIYSCLRVKPIQIYSNSSDDLSHFNLSKVKTSKLKAHHRLLHSKLHNLNLDIQGLSSIHILPSRSEPSIYSRLVHFSMSHAPFHLSPILTSLPSYHLIFNTSSLLSSTIPSFIHLQSKSRLPIGTRSKIPV